MNDHNPVRRAPGALLLLSSLAACAGAGPAATAPEPAPARLPYVPVSPALPPIPEVAGALDVRVVHPTPTTPKPRVDSTFIYGSVGSGQAALSINGTPVPVAPNGAFLAYLPVPADGRWQLLAQSGGERVDSTVAYAARADSALADSAAASPPAAAAGSGAFAAPRLAVVSGGADTLATGSDVAVGRPTPTGTYRWFLPRGARVAVTERRGDQYRVQLDSATTAWIDAGALTLADSAVTTVGPATLGRVEVRPAAGWADVRLRAHHLPFRVEAAGSTLLLTVHRGTPGETPRAPADPLLQGITYERAAGGSAALRLTLASEPWGYKAFYEPDGTLVLRVRRPPAVDPARPLRGVRIAIDPGHPPAGATGPTGLTEADANLAIGTRLAERLRAAGAEVLLTRTDGAAVPLAARTDTAVKWSADLLVSVHNNAFGEGVDPFRSHGTSVYYFQPFSAALARELDREIVGVTRIPDLGARQSNLALARPTWMPSALTESLYMLIPEQEAALRDPGFLDRLADAHVRGIEAFLRARAAGAGTGTGTPAERR